jgi:hypothetical protein
MFPALAAAIRDLDVPVDGRALGEALRLLDQLSAKVVAAVGEFDHAQLWDVDGATSMHAWLRDAGLSGRDAGRLRATGRAVQALPELRDAWERGELSAGQVDAVVANVKQRVALFAEHEAAVVPTLVGLSVDDTVRVTREMVGAR